MSRPRYWDVYRAVRDSKQTISQQELRKMFSESPLRGLQLVPLDSRYVIVDTNTIGLVTAYNGVDLEEYKSESYDCDNFALSFAGDVPQRWDVNCIGIVIDFSAGHAYNCAATIDNGIVIIEPQNDTLFLDYSPYAAKSGFVLFA